MSIDGDLIEVRLRSKEIAYLVPVIFDERGRNFMWRVALVRPSRKEVREAGFPVERDIKIHDLDHDGVSEVAAAALGSGQGVTKGARSIVQFDGWKPIVLHRARFAENEGEYGTQDDRFFSRDVVWKFVDIDGDGILDLVEEIKSMKGRNNRRPLTTKVTNTFLFKSNRFVKSVVRK